MARIRTVKPEFFKHEILGILPVDASLLFIGLWILADRRGFIEDRPLRIKADIFPYRDVDMEGLLRMLEGNFIRRIIVDEKPYIQVINFEKHQVLNKREPESTVPAQYWNTTKPVPVVCRNSTGTVPELWEGEREGEREKEREEEGEEEGNMNPQPPFLNNPSGKHPEHALLSFQETSGEFLANPDWQNLLSKKFNLPIEKLKAEMTKFLSDLVDQNEFPRDITDTRRYFISWYQKGQHDKKVAANLSSKIKRV